MRNKPNHFDDDWFFMFDSEVCQNIASFKRLIELLIEGYLRSQDDFDFSMYQYFEINYPFKNIKGD